MVTLTIDNETYQRLRQQAAVRGLSVEQWLKSQSQVESGGQLPISTQAKIWHDHLIAFAQRHRPTGTPLETSREKIYD